MSKNDPYTGEWCPTCGLYPDVEEYLEGQLTESRAWAQAWKQAAKVLRIDVDRIQSHVIEREKKIARQAEEITMLIESRKGLKTRNAALEAALREADPDHPLLGESDD